jgi:subtilisin family serine protease
MKAKLRLMIHPLVLSGAAMASPLSPGVVEAPEIGVRYIDLGQPRIALRGAAVHDRTAIRVELPDGRTFNAEIDQHALVQLAPDADPAAVWARYQLEPVQSIFAQINLYRVRSQRAEDGLAIAGRLASALGDDLLQVIPDLWLVHTLHSYDAPPNDPRYPGQWFLDRINIEDAWAIGTGAPEVSIVVIDGGCQTAHPDLDDKMDPGWDVVEDDDDPNPAVGFGGSNHGTAVAGVIAAETNNDQGVAGACPECRLRCVRLLPADEAPVPISADANAFAFALENDAWVVNNSWGFRDATPVPGPLRTAIVEVMTEGRDGRGTVVVFAVGNESRHLGDDELPAIPGVLGVGATNNFDELTQFSNTGNAVDIVAPTGTLTTDLVGADGDDPGDYTNRFGGTSSAAPVISGIVGLLLAEDPNRTAQAVQDALMGTAQQSLFATPSPGGHDALYGWGVVRPAHAMRAYLGLPEPGEEPDAAIQDAAPNDATPPPDAQMPTMDAQVSNDAATTTGADAQAGDDGCQSTPSEGPLVFALAVLLLMIRRREEHDG